jgi:hypothetical protein
MLKDAYLESHWITDDMNETKVIKVYTRVHQKTGEKKVACVTNGCYGGFSLPDKLDKAIGELNMDDKINRTNIKLVEFVGSSHFVNDPDGNVYLGIEWFTLDALIYDAWTIIEYDGSEYVEVNEEKVTLRQLLVTLRQLVDNINNLLKPSIMNNDANRIKQLRAMMSNLNL